MLSQVTRIVLAVALLAGWQAALEHPLRHVDERDALVHDGHSRSGEMLCDALDALTACVSHAAQPPVATVRVEFLLQLRDAGAPRVADAPPFLSQGPPASA